MTDLQQLIIDWDSKNRSIFYEQMADYMDHAGVRKMEKECDDLEQQINQIANRPSAYEEVTELIEEKDPDVFNSLIADLDSEGGNTLYDIFNKYNNIHKCKITIPSETLKKLNIPK